MKKVFYDFMADTISAYYGITKKEMLSKSQKHIYLIPRQVFMYFCYTENIGSYSEIGKYCKREHATVISAVKMIKSDIDTNKGFRKTYEQIRTHLIKKGEVDFVISKLLANPKDVLALIKQKLEAA
ncbi:hypothetical protein FGF1_03760 [Flavobacteriaceae bacterium GF1]